ncbi:hypothetical protein QAD02_010777 [Eretmocerus hayati]|uniref:Uncharacterized protein n=1 Tax=Eretmocerus hayati TaxID=131215 RepID=A0ACC2NV05_9HYME|nr:hypothetical protein QAD02_010777 [Eretmocerus hayati]
MSSDSDNLLIELMRKLEKSMQETQLQKNRAERAETELEATKKELEALKQKQHLSELRPVPNVAMDNKVLLRRAISIPTRFLPQFIRKTANELKYIVKKKIADGELVPPDGGWGWFVLVAAVMVNVLIPGGIKSFGVIYRAFLTTYNGSAKKGSLIPALCYFLYSSLGPLSSVLSVKYSYRTVTLIGGTFAAAGMMLSYFATEIEHLYITYGILVGIGAGLAFPPTVYIVTSYFVRLRGLANGFCISGSSLGSIFLPPILTWMLEDNTVSVTILIMGALTLNVWACALLYEPVENHVIPAASYRSVSTVTSPARPSVGSLDYSEPDTINIAVSSPEDEKRAALKNYYKAAGVRTRKISMPVGQREIAGQMHSTPALYAVPESINNSTGGSTRHRRTGAVMVPRVPNSSQQPPLSPSSSSFNYISTPYHGSTLTALHPEYASTLTLNAITSTFRKSPEKQARPGRGSGKGDVEDEQQNKFFDFSLLSDPMYLVILISNSTNAISYTNFVIVLTLYAEDMEFTLKEASFLLSIVSLFDLTGRIGGAALSDTKIMPKHFYFVGGLLISGISLAILPIAWDLYSVAAICSVFGLASGVYVGVTAVVMADMLGVDKLTSSYGISLFVNGVLQLVGPPICALLYERIERWDVIFCGLGIILIAGAALWGFVPFIRARQKKRTALVLSQSGVSA